MIAPEHMVQGSKVTYMSMSSRRQSPSFLHALSMAITSAWAMALPRVRRRLWALTKILPSFTMTQPMGHSPRSMAFSASLIASSMKRSLSEEGLKSGYNLDLVLGTENTSHLVFRTDNTDGERKVSRSCNLCLTI